MSDPVDPVDPDPLDSDISYEIDDILVDSRGVCLIAKNVDTGEFVLSVVNHCNDDGKGDDRGHGYFDRYGRWRTLQRLKRKKDKDKRKDK